MPGLGQHALGETQPSALQAEQSPTLQPKHGVLPQQMLPVGALSGHVDGGGGGGGGVPVPEPVPVPVPVAVAVASGPPST